MRKFGWIAAAMLAACAPDGPVETSAPVADAVVAQDEIGGLLNAARAGAGLAPLSRSPKLVAAAQDHAADMARAGFFSHTGSDGSTPSVRVERRDYGYCFVAENIAQGQPDAAAAMGSWMASAGHRANNLSTRATEYGAARSQGNTWVLVFGKPGC